MRAAPPSTRHSRVGWFARARSCGRRALLAAGAFALLTPRLAFASVGAVPLRGRIFYALQQAVIRNAGLAVAAFFATAVLTGGWLFFKVNPETESLGEATYQAYSLLNDIPGADCSANPGVLSRLLGTSLHITGVFTFAVVLGIVSDGISTKIESARLSNERVLETGHTVLLNWGEYTRPVLRQLEAARREGRLKGPVVIIADKDKEEMDELVKDELDNLQPPSKLSVTTRTGSPSELSNMQRAAAGTAQRIIVTQPEDVEPEEYARQYKESAALALSLQESAEPSQPAKRADVVVSAPRGVGGGFIHGERCVGEGCSETSGFSSYAEVAPVDFVSRLLAQCTAQPGLSRVYAEIFEQGKGAELYAEPVAKSLVGRSFGEAWRYFERATPLGVLTAAGEVKLSPEDGLVFAKGDKVVLLADTAQACRACRAPLRAAEAPDAAAAAAQPAEKLAPKRLLLLGWNPQMPDLLAQIDEVSPAGSTITILSEAGAGPPATAASALRRCRLEQVEADPTRVEDLRQMQLGKIDSILILQEGDGGEVQDSHSLACILAVQEALRREGVAAPAGPRLVGELVDPTMAELIESRFTGRKTDLLLPCDLASGTLVQFALQPELKSIYSELLSPEGKEVILASPASYVREGEALGDLSFATLYQRARARGEVALGVQRGGAENVLELNPRMHGSLRLEPTDQIAVLGDAF